MELSNINKLSLSVALSLMSEKYSLSRIRMKSARNLSNYQISSEDQMKSYYIGFDEEKDYSKMFGEMMQDVLYERFPIHSSSSNIIISFGSSMPYISAQAANTA